MNRTMDKKREEYIRNDRKQIREKFANHMNQNCFRKEVILYGKMNDWKVKIDEKLGDDLEELEIAVWSSDTELFMLQDYLEIDQEQLQDVLTKQYIDVYSVAFEKCRVCRDITSIRQLQNKKQPGVCKSCRNQTHAVEEQDVTKQNPISSEYQKEQEHVLQP